MYCNEASGPCRDLDNVVALLLILQLPNLILLILQSPSLNNSAIGYCRVLYTYSVCKTFMNFILPLK